MNPATIITGALLSQVLLAVIMFIAASIIHVHHPRHGRVQVQYTWFILILLLLSVAILVFTQSLSSFWVGLFQNTSFTGIPDKSATLAVFLINITITTLLVATTGGSENSPFQPILFLIPTLAILLFESSLRVVIYAALVSVSFTFLLAAPGLTHDRGNNGAKWAYGFVCIASLGLAALIGLLTRICPEGVC